MIEGNASIDKTQEYWRLDFAANDLGRQLVDLGEEPRNEQLGGVMIEVFRAPDLDQASGAHHADAIAETHRLLGMMRHDHARRARFTQQ